MSKGKRRQGGFTIIEVAIGMLFIAIGLLALAGLHAVSIRGNSISNHLMHATYMAQDRLEYFRNLPRDRILSEHKGDREDGKESMKIPGTRITSDLVFNRFYTVEETGGLITITYRVTWNDGKSHHISMTTQR